MGDRNEKLLLAALDVFSRYGIKRATMNDIASQAGVSRQTVYATFANKDEILSSCIIYWADTIRQEVELVWKDMPKLPDRLDIFFQRTVIEPFEWMAASPDSEDMILGNTPVAKSALLEADKMKRDGLALALADYEAEIAAYGQSVEQLAEFVLQASSSFKHSAHSVAELRVLLQTLKVAVLAICKA